MRRQHHGINSNNNNNKVNWVVRWALLGFSLLLVVLQITGSIGLFHSTAGSVLEQDPVKEQLKESTSGSINGRRTSVVEQGDKKTSHNDKPDNQQPPAKDGKTHSQRMIEGFLAAFPQQNEPQEEPPEAPKTKLQMQAEQFISEAKAKIQADRDRLQETSKQQRRVDPSRLVNGAIRETRDPNAIHRAGSAIDQAKARLQGERDQLMLTATATKRNPHGSTNLEKEMEQLMASHKVSFKPKRGNADPFAKQEHGRQPSQTQKLIEALREEVEAEEREKQKQQEQQAHNNANAKQPEPAIKQQQEPPKPKWIVSMARPENEPQSATAAAAAATTTISSRRSLFFDPPPINSTSIRRWGCTPRNETPFIFVHLGKAGGGNVRARIAAAAKDYQRKEWHQHKEDTTYYYPIRETTGNNTTIIWHGKMANSEMNNFLPLDDVNDLDGEFPFSRTFTFEGISSCHAITPLGHAIACGFEKDLCAPHRDDDKRRLNGSGLRCDTIVLGHGAIGNELHWLPTPFLVQWWNQSTWTHSIPALQRMPGDDAKHQAHYIRSVGEKLAKRFDRSHLVFDETKKKKNLRFCKSGSPSKRFWYMNLYQKCMKPTIPEVDVMARKAVHGLNDKDKKPKQVTSRIQQQQQQRQDFSSIHETPQHWSSVYASLPVLRVTLIREPFSWLSSRFFWKTEHVSGRQNKQGFIVPYFGEKNAQIEWENSLSRKGKGKDHTAIQKTQCDNSYELAYGWGKQYAIEFIFYFCGEHCMGQFMAIKKQYSSNEVMLLKQMARYLKVMEDQAAYNLRNSFAVVGLLDKTPDFFDMISKRVDYLDTSLNPRVRGDDHASGYGKEWNRCKTKFQEDETFQKKIKKKCPEIAAAARLYQVAEEVYRFQKQELDQCMD